MTRITRYILRQLTVATLIVALGLLGIIWLTQSLRFIGLIVDKGVSFLDFLNLTLLLLPNFLIIVLPISLFAVVLFTYNRLMGDRELVVMRAAGLSPWQLARPALLLAAGLTVVGYALTLYLSPLAMSAFKERQWELRNDVSQVLLQEGAFNRLEKGLTVYVRERGASGEMRGLLVYDQRMPEQPVTIMAERGVLSKMETGSRVLMLNGSRQSVNPETHKLSLLYFDSYTMELGGGGLSGGRTPEAAERPTLELFTLQQADVPSLDADDLRGLRAEGHQRLSQPLTNIGFALIALAGLLTGSFNRRGAMHRILAAVGVMIVCEAAFVGAVNLTGDSLLFAPLVYAAALLPTLLAGAFLWLSTRETLQPLPGARTA